MLRMFVRQHVATGRPILACDMFWHLGYCWLKFEVGPIWANNKHIATRRNRVENARNMLRPTLLRYVALTCYDRSAGSLVFGTTAQIPHARTICIYLRTQAMFMYFPNNQKLYLLNLLSLHINCNKIQLLCQLTEFVNAFHGIKT